MKTKPLLSRHGGQLEEASIKWLHDPTKYRYVREKYTICAQRVVFPKKHIGDGKIILVLGYAILKDSAPSTHPGCFRRRTWYIKPSIDPWESGAPGEAVVTTSISPGRESTETH